MLPEETLTHVADCISIKIISTVDDIQIVLRPLDGRLIVTT